MDAIELIKDDHRHIEELFGKYLQTESEDTQENLFQEIESGLTAHSEMEEQVLYARLKSVAEDEVKHSLEEHAEVKQLLMDMLDLDLNDEAFDSKMLQLMDSVRAHVEEEEASGGILELAGEHFDRNQLLEMGRQMQEIQRRTEEDLAA